MKTIELNIEYIKNESHRYLMEYAKSIDKRSKNCFACTDSNLKIYGIDTINNLVVYSFNESKTDTIIIDDFEFASKDMILNVEGDLLYVLNKMTYEFAVIDLGKKEKIFNVNIQENIEQDKFVMSQIYGHPSFKTFGGNNLYMQVGDYKDSLNFTGEYIYRQVPFLGDSSSPKYFINYPSEFAIEYIHYTDAISCELDQYIYVTFPIFGKIYRVSRTGVLEKSFPINGHYAKFDDKRINDLLYIHDYTNVSNYNVDIHSLGSHVVVLQRNKKGIHYLMYFNSELNKIGQVKVREVPSYSYICSFQDTLYMLSGRLDKTLKVYFNE